MKKIFALLIALMLTMTAFAATVSPMIVDITAPFEDCVLNVGFKIDAITDTTLIADVYTEQWYDLVDIATLQVGDTFVCNGEEMIVESISQENWGVDINGGLEQDGVTLLTEEDSNGFVAYNMDNPAYLLIGCEEFGLSEQITFRHWQQNEDGSISDEMTEATLTPAQVKEALSEEGEAVYPTFLQVHVVNEVIVGIAVNYVP